MYNSKGSKVLNCKLKINAMQMCVVDMYCPKLSNMYVTLNVKVRYILNCELWQVLRVQCCATVSVSSASYFRATVTILPSHCLLSATSRNPAATCSHVVDSIVVCEADLYILMLSVCTLVTLVLKDVITLAY